jgi:dTDP-4-dehydrorhamnose 3,5-epimerase-like enzyme
MMTDKCYIFDIKTVKDPRGCLSSIEATLDIPIEVKRIFYMHHVVTDRGGHAHTDTDQVIIAMYGTIKIRLFDGVNAEEYVMDDCTKGLYVPRLTFTDLYDFSPDAVCLVLANTHYDMKKSLRNMHDYLEYLKNNPHE